MSLLRGIEGVTGCRRNILWFLLRLRTTDKQYTGAWNVPIQVQLKVGGAEPTRLRPNVPVLVGMGPSLHVWC